MRHGISLLFFFALGNAFAAPASNPAIFEKSVATSLSCVQTLLPHDDYSYPHTPEEFKVRHPSFYGCFDWHASVFNHAALIRTLNENPQHPRAAEIKALLANHFSADNLKIELKTMEEDIILKLYEPAWFMQMMVELRQATYPEAAKWIKNLEPMEKLAVQIFSDELPQRRYANTNMMHENTAFALSHAWDYAVFSKNGDLQNLISERAKYFFLNDKDCDASNEIDDDHNIIGFISPCFTEADFMRRILPKAEFATWFKGFFLKLPESYLKVVEPRGKYPYYQTGLMVTKATVMRGLAGAVDDSQIAAKLNAAANVQSQAAEKIMFDYGYIGDHWIPAFYIYSAIQ